MKSVIIATGGTGGHIYPAIAVAEALKKQDPDYLIFFVGTKLGMENQIVPQKGYPLLHLPIGRLHKSVGWKERAQTLFQMPIAFFKAAWFCIKIRPQFLIGFGGHASGPMILIASLLGFKTFIWEPNAFPGMANRILSKFVSRCFVVFDSAKAKLNPKKSIKVGIPIRDMIESMGRLPQSQRETFHILVYGGSQGSLAISESVIHFYEKYQKELSFLRLLLQTGQTHFEKLKNECEKRSLLSENFQLVPYIHDMDAKYQWADLVMSRSGAGTISELASTGLPSVLIPLPTAADGHQQKNAEELVEKGGAIMILQNQL
ncbi:MAG: UDP-N-acetylglucosamine--N-acetylmuramyl-(pentapeptide) pyrophosphoryl-undecaprenol N-acetylglucosamine transferase, partial [Bdellovibrionales bacterium]|nr:UDP-N-acetylglucosamine--N-acetylmuramyl-(pentapeptide) pyrophosphoryl-undecaprenol N-acetylglucosamine transferase [Bdellovibrionales bacterium]